MKAVILAGGEGARLRPFTTVIPKPLMPVGQYPILEIILRQLRRAGVDDVLLAVGYLHHLIEDFFQDGRKFGLTIAYAFEDKPLGTAGPIAAAIERFKDDFIVMNGDLLTTLDYRGLFTHHMQSQAAATIGVFSRDVQMNFGVIELSEANTLANYVEKPRQQVLVSMGINVVNSKRVRPFIEAGKYLEIPTLMTNLKDAGQLVACYRASCEWLDIGRADDYQIANELFSAEPARFIPELSEH